MTSITTWATVFGYISFIIGVLKEIVCLQYSENLSEKLAVPTESSDQKDLPLLPILSISLFLSSPLCLCESEKMRSSGSHDLWLFLLWMWSHTLAEKTVHSEGFDLAQQRDTHFGRASALAEKSRAFGIQGLKTDTPPESFPLSLSVHMPTWNVPCFFTCIIK